MPRDGDDDERARKLFVGGLDYDTTDHKLQEHFGQWGDLTDFVVMKFPDTRRSRGFGFITFSSKDMLEDCMRASPHNLDGKTVELTSWVQGSDSSQVADNSGISIGKLETQLILLKATFKEKESMLESLKTRCGPNSEYPTLDALPPPQEEQVEKASCSSVENSEEATNKEAEPPAA